MIWLAILHLGLSGQDVATFDASGIDLPAEVVASRETPYRSPAVRPFEPPSDFGRDLAEGDTEQGRHRRPLHAPVTVNGYLHSYEVSLSDGEIAYAQGVTQAEIDADARMGSLDGRWRVLAQDGAPVLSLVLSDAGEASPIEGAWRRPGTPGLSGDLGVIAGVVRSLKHLDIELEDTPGSLTLSPAADGQWVGLLTEDGRIQPVVLRRPT